MPVKSYDEPKFEVIEVTAQVDTCLLPHLVNEGHIIGLHQSNLGEYMKQCVVVLHKGSKVTLLGKDHRLAEGALTSLRSVTINLDNTMEVLPLTGLPKTVHLIGAQFSLGR